MNRRILALNTGSSSVKYRLIDVSTRETVARGLVERVVAGGYDAVLEKILAELADEHIDAVGHRIVHGGSWYDRAVVVDDAVEARIGELSSLAPLHNPPALAALRAVRLRRPNLPNVAVFDTAFHASLPDHARTYAIDRDVALQHGIRRYGFHGISVSYVSREAAAFLNSPSQNLRMIVLHLGSGASATAIADGRSVDTSMGFTPVEGLVMGSRPGDMDPAILVQLQRQAGFSSDELDQLLQRSGGLKGLSGHADMRDVLADATAGGENARLAVEVYLHRLRRYIGAYAVELGGLDALVFTAGVGEHSALIRERAVERLGFLNIHLDREVNNSTETGARRISTPGSSAEVLVVPTDEELEIARQTADLLG